MLNWGFWEYFRWEGEQVVIISGGNCLKIMISEVVTTSRISKTMHALLAAMLEISCSVLLLYHVAEITKSTG